MKSKKLIAFLSAVTMLGSAFCTLPAMAAAGDDIVRNGNMEGHPKESLLPDYWGHHSTWRSAEDGGSYIDSVAEGRNINGNNVLVLSEVTDENAAGFGFNRGAVQYINDTAETSKNRILPGKSYEVSLTIGNLNETGVSTYQVIFEGAGNPTYENNTVTIAAGETGYIKDALISVPIDASVQYSSVVIQPVDSKGTFWIDDVSIIERADVIEEINTPEDLSAAFTNGGAYIITQDLTVTSPVQLSDSTAASSGMIDGQNNSISYSDSNNAMLDIEGSNSYSWSFSDMTMSGNGRFLILNNTKSSVNFTDVNFDTSATNASIINRGGKLTLDNVVFPDRTDDAYDIISQWGCGDVIVKGATKARIYREESFYSLNTSGLTKGADVFVKFNNTPVQTEDEIKAAHPEYDEEQITKELENQIARLERATAAYNGVSVSDPSLQIIRDEENLSVHIITKPDEPAEEPEFAGVVINVVAANGTGDKADTSATAFETGISNKGGEGTVTSITWDITANGTTKSATANPTEMTLDNGASVNLVLIVNGLYTTENNTVVTVE